MPTNVENHKRENDILLGFLERPALNWLASHSPAWVTPDLLTWTGVAAIRPDFRKLRTDPI